VPNDQGGWLPGFEAAVTSDGRVYVTIYGDLDATNVAALAGQLAVLAYVRPARLVIDMAGVSFLDCAAARILAGTAAFLPTGQLPVLISLRPVARRVLDLTEMAGSFDIAD
jgi:anti-anti-sigma factor